MENDILKILAKDARIPPEKIATMTGKSLEEVNSAISEAEKNRIILNYGASIDWEKTGKDQVHALIEVKVTPQKDVGFDAIAQRIARSPQAQTVYLVSGTYDLLVVAVARTEREIAEFVSQKLAPIEGVQATVTHFVLKRYKENGDVLDVAAEVKRQPVIF